MNETNIVQPRIAALSQAQIEQVHEYSLRILSTTGVRVDSERVRQAFAGAAPVDGDRVRIPPELVEWAIKAAPSTVDVYDRLGNLAFCLGNDRMRFGIGVTTLYYQDPMTDEETPFARKHMESMVRLGDALPNFDVISTVGIIQDVPPEVSDLYAIMEMIANTSKPLVVLVSDEGRFPAVLDLAQHLHGDLASRPLSSPTLTPLPL